MIKVLYFLNSIVRGGVEEHVIGLIQGLNRSRFEPILVCPQELLDKLFPPPCGESQGGGTALSGTVLISKHNPPLPQGEGGGEGGRKQSLTCNPAALQPSQPLQPDVIIRTYKSGKFGRYIADLWYAPLETDREAILKKGKLLNQVLLDQGLAEIAE